ncbi:multicellular organismal development [Nesidiocoris tenuis]|uniref:Multicellular organismal development n=1 Tax=Nesidiocoris tenuis TaxID=355587 RepID=A0ABN7B9J0_9HEMI|nr:multicellular organismal development [Nesidiocoris tenuis]
MNNEINVWAKSCLGCQQAKISRHTKPPYGQFAPSDLFAHVHLDLVGPLPCSENKSYLLTMIDRHSSWVEAVPLARMTAESVARAFYEQWVCRYGTPSRITTDQGRQFESDLFAALSEILGAHKIHSLPYHPIANGRIERVHRSLKATLMAMNSRVPWTKRLPAALIGLRSAVQTDSGISPFEIAFRHHMRLPGDIFNLPSQADIPFIKDIKNSLHHDTRAKFFLPADLQTCTHVFMRVETIRPALVPPYVGPYKVLNRLPSGFTILKDGVEVTIPLERLKPAHLDPELAHPGEFLTSCIENTDPAISQIQGIMSNFDKLINEVNPTPLPSTQQHALLDELVTTTLLKLDEVNIGSHASGRAIRKSAVNQVMHFANLLDEPTEVLGEKGHLSEPSDASSRPKKHSADFPSTSTTHRELSTFPYMKRKTTTTHNGRPNTQKMPTRLKSSPAEGASAAIRSAQHSSGLALHHPSPLKSASPSLSVSTDSQHWTRESPNHKFVSPVNFPGTIPPDFQTVRSTSNHGQELHHASRRRCRDARAINATNYADVNWTNLKSANSSQATGNHGPYPAKTIVPVHTIKVPIPIADAPPPVRSATSGTAGRKWDSARDRRKSTKTIVPALTVNVPIPIADAPPPGRSATSGTAGRRWGSARDKRKSTTQASSNIAKPQNRTTTEHCCKPDTTGKIRPTITIGSTEAKQPRPSGPATQANTKTGRQENNYVQATVTQHGASPTCARSNNGHRCTTPASHQAKTKASGPCTNSSQIIKVHKAEPIGRRCTASLPVPGYGQVQGLPNYKTNSRPFNDQRPPVNLATFSDHYRQRTRYFWNSSAR